MKDCIETHKDYATKWCKKRNRSIGQHRLVWEQHHGEIPKGLVVRHKCDNPRCINIDHLEIGTQYDNMQDKMQKGRHNPTQGIKHGQHKLTEEQVLDIRAKHNKVKAQQLAEQYNVSKSTIQDIQYRKSWKHI